MFLNYSVQFHASNKTEHTRAVANSQVTLVTISRALTIQT